MVLTAALITHRIQGLMRALGHVEVHWDFMKKNKFSIASSPPLGL